MKKNGKMSATPLRRLTDALVTKALNEAAQDAVELHRRAGLPLAVWQNGKVALVSADSVAPARHCTKPRRPNPRGKKRKK